MQGSGRHNVVFSAAVCAAIAALLIGCGGGNKLITNRAGLVESGRLVLDSIPQAPAPEEYVIGQGDVLDIVFLYNSELNQRELKVRPDGRISLPHVGEMRVDGMSVSQLDSVLNDRFSEIILRPKVTVILREFQSPTVYVLGSVRAPGGYEFTRDMTLLQLLALGGGGIEKDMGSSVLVIRRVAPDHIVGIQIDFDDLTAGNRFDLDFPLKPYDIVYVPRSRLNKAADFVNAVYDVLVHPMDLYIKGWQVANVNLMYDYYRLIGQRF